ncbi:MAG: sigma 54-interacting transcriptional regulator [Thermoguttaceae bacterium]|jgi:DNA-binding NtrC family response regulator
MEITHGVLLTREPAIGQTIHDALKSDGVRPSFTTAAAECLALLESEAVEALFLDLNVPAVNDEFLRSAVSIQPRLTVVIVVDRGLVEAVRQRVRMPRVEYLAKPFTVEEVRAVLRKIRTPGSGPSAPSAVPAMAAPNGGASSRSAPADRTLIAQSAAMRRIIALVAKAGASDAPVLLEGEPGNGKSLLAAEIHSRSAYARGPFVRVACGAISESALDEMLFPPRADGAENGRRPAPGIFQQAEGGTLFLKEVCQFPLWAQARLLDLLQSGRLQARIIASVKCNVEEAAASGRFDAGLYYYLNVVRVTVPPLRHRQEDIPALAEYFLAHATAAQAVAPRGSAKAVARRFSARAREVLLGYPWPGNALQLASVVARAAVLSEGAEIGESCLTEMLGKVRSSPASESIRLPLSGGLKDMERFIIEEVILRCRGNKAAAARCLRLHRRTLYRLLQDKESSPAPPLVLTPDAQMSNSPGPLVGGD